MPRKRYRARRFHSRRGRGKRRRTRYRARRRRLSRRLPALTGFPKRKLVRLRWTRSVSLNASDVTPAKHAFIANSPYGPDYESAIEHQPLGFDQWTAIYDHWYCIGSKIKATYTNTSSSNNTPGAFGIILDDNHNLDYTSTEQILESKQGSSAVILAGGTAGQRTRSAYKRYSHRKFNGSRTIVNTEQFKGFKNDHCAEKNYFILWAGSLHGNDPATMHFYVTIDYLVIFAEPTFLARS